MDSQKATLPKQPKLRKTGPVEEYSFDNRAFLFERQYDEIENCLLLKASMACSCMTIDDNRQSGEQNSLYVQISRAKGRQFAQPYQEMGHCCGLNSTSQVQTKAFCCLLR